MAETNDLDLVKQCLSGNIQAFAELVDRYQNPVYNVALRMLKDPQSAEDVTQAVFIKAFEKLDTYKSRFKFFSWVYRMAINESLNFIKREKRFACLDIDTLSSRISTERDFSTIETTHQMEVALMFLEPEQRAIIILKHFHGMSYKEIGYIMDTPEKTIKSRLYESRLRLRDILIKQGVVH